MTGFYLKLFLVNFTAMFAGAAGCYLFKLEPPAALLAALYPAGLFAVLITFAAGPFHAAASKKIAGAACGAEIYRTRQSAELSIGLDYNELFSLVHRYLKEKAGFEIAEADTRTRRITARSPITLKTFGNVIIIEFDNTDPILTKLKILSRPRLSTTMLDYGENLKIVLDIRAYLLQNATHQ